jgi:hypothetical protein
LASRCGVSQLHRIPPPRPTHDILVTQRALDLWDSLRFSSFVSGFRFILIYERCLVPPTSGYPLRGRCPYRMISQTVGRLKHQGNLWQK